MNDRNLRLIGDGRKKVLTVKYLEFSQYTPLTAKTVVGTAVSRPYKVCLKPVIATLERL